MVPTDIHIGDTGPTDWDMGTEDFPDLDSEGDLLGKKGNIY